MSGSLLDSAWSYLSNSALIEKLSSAVGLSPEKTQEALKAIVPTTFAGAIQSASSESGAKRLFDMLHQFDGSMLSDLGSRLQGGNIDEMAHSGKGVLTTLFGGRLGPIEDLLTRISGVGKGPISALLGLAGTFVMNLLGKVKNEQGLSAGGFREMLLSQKDAVAKAAPPGLASALGVGSLANLGGTAAAAKEKIEAYGDKAQERAAAAYATHERRAPAAAVSSSAARWLGVGLACLALVGVIWFLRERSRQFAESPAPTASPTAGDQRPLVGRPIGNLINVRLPSGANIDLEPGSAAMSVVEFTRRGSAGTERFALAEVAFDREGSQLTADSAPALDRLATVLKEYPDIRLRVRSYAPADADQAAARRIAAQRADRIKTHLLERGVRSDRVQAEALGQSATQPAAAPVEVVIERINLNR